MSRSMGMFVTMMPWVMVNITYSVAANTHKYSTLIGRESAAKQMLLSYWMETPNGYVYYYLYHYTIIIRAFKLQFQKIMSLVTYTLIISLSSHFSISISLYQDNTQLMVTE